MNALVSIIVPCYNLEEYIAQTLDSVLSQTYPNWECIVVDDGSLDNSSEVVERYMNKDSRFSYIYQENHGPSVARNNGIKHAKGEFILPLDADDLIDATYIEKALNVFEEKPEMKVVYCKAVYFGCINQQWNLQPYSYESLLWENMIFCSALFRKSDFEKTNGYNPNMINGLEDWDFWLTFITPKDQVCRIEENLFYYRQKEVSRSKDADAVTLQLTQQIYDNHKECYAPYVHNIIFMYQQVESLKKDIKYSVNEVLNSKAYRLGKAILKPFKWMKKKWKRYKF